MPLATVALRGTFLVVSLNFDFKITDFGEGVNLSFNIEGVMEGN